jgi:alkylation response protein AidB-like acyl-CoA dehydrogenase
MVALGAFLLAVCLTSGACGLLGPFYGDQKQAYLLALAEGDGAGAWALLCPDAQARIPSADDLTEAYRHQVDAFDLIDRPNSWASLHGTDDAGYTAFRTEGGGEVTLVLPIDFDAADHASMCPTTDNVLGDPI